MASSYTNFSYPVFQPGQALKSNDLNNLVQYLETHDRLTRAYLIGSGVFYGLEWDFDGDNNLCINKGAGVSSDGYLFALKREVNSLGDEVPCCLDYCKEEDLQYRMFNPYLKESDLPGFAPPANTVNTFKGYELIKLPPNSTPSDGFEIIKGNPVKELPKDWCLVLYWDAQTSNRKSCIDSCDGTGGDTVYNMRFFLMSPESVKVIWRKATGGATGGADFSGLLPYLTRLHKAKALFDMVQPEDLYTAWVNVVKPAIETPPPPGSAIGTKPTAGPLSEAIVDALAGITVPAGMTPDTLTTKFQALFTAVTSDPNKPFLQYLHDYLCDLIATINEIAGLKSAVSQTQCPDETLFPRFIAVGGAASNAAGAGCRMPFYRLPLQGSADGQTGKLEFLQKKLLYLVDKASILIPRIEKEVHITGSDFKSFPLSEQAIPFYYDKPNVVRTVWNYELNNANRTALIQSFEFPGDTGLNLDTAPLSTAAEPYPRSILCYDLKGEMFFRIEGHLNKPLSQGYTAVEKLRREVNLPFKIVLLRLSPKPTFTYNGTNPEVLSIINQMQFSDFAADHPGMEHMAGVPTGGTFIMVFKEEIPAEYMHLFNNPQNPPPTETIDVLLPNIISRTIIADFCLPYGCYVGPNVKYCFKEEIVNTPPCAAEADFEDKQIHDRVYVFENRSALADSFLWEVFKMDDGIMVDPAIESQEIKKGVGINVLADFTHTFDYGEYIVRLTATCDEDHLTDVAEKRFLFCPEEPISITTLNLDGLPQFHLEVDEGTDQEFTFMGSPAGGTWDYKAFKISGMDTPVEQTKDKLVLNFKDVKLQLNPPNGPIAESFLIKYEFPCDDATVEFQVTINPPPQVILSRVSNTQNPAALELQAGYQQQANDLPDSGLKSSAAFKKAMNFLQTPPPDSESVFDKFDDVAAKLITAIKAPGKLDVAQLKSLLQNATYLFLDRLVLESDPTLQADALKKFKKLANSLAAQSITLTNWQGATLTTNQKLTDSITKTL